MPSSPQDGVGPAEVRSSPGKVSDDGSVPAGTSDEDTPALAMVTPAVCVMDVGVHIQPNRSLLCAPWGSNPDPSD